LEATLFERFTDRARRVVVLAQEAAKGLGHNYLGTEHILLGVIREEEGMGAQVLIDAGISAQKVLEKITEMVPPGDAIIKGPIPFTPRAKKAIEMALREALQLGHNYIGTEHLLLGLIREGETAASELLASEGIDIDIARKAILEKLESTLRAEEKDGDELQRAGSEGSEEEGEQPRISRNLPSSNKSKDALESYAYDLTERARQGLLDPVIGRDKEIDRTIETLARRTKNNPVLIGEPGVGKTAIVEGLAQAIVNGDAPKILKDKAIYTVDLAGMVAGAKYRGEFEERLKKLLAEVKKRKNVILFIDELHTLVGAGASEGSVDAANILKPLLARGEIRTIGATTLDEYRKYVEKDAALERRFQPIIVEPPTVEHSIKIMKGLRERYEEHHGIKITDEALVSSVVLSDRYLPDRFLPDKAIDLLDEASARLRLRSARESVDISGFIKELEEIREAKSLAILNEEMDRLSELKTMEEEVLNAQRAEILAAETAAEEEGAPKPVLSTEDIAKVLASATGVPVSHLTSEETSRLLQMEDELHASLVGQDQAVKALSRAVRRTRAGLKDPKRPAGSFIFAGPSGVGKTELSKALATFLFGDENSLITLDMSEYSEKHNVARLFGAPPGYVGYEEGGQLTERVRRKPFSVILLDEIEKAHPDVFNTLLQVLDEGRLTDSQGRSIDFKNTVIIMTTNLGSREIGKGQSLGFHVSSDSTSNYERMQNTVSEELKKQFRPEFLNRIDETIVFHQLDQNDIIKITDLMIGSLNERLSDRKMGIKLTEAAKIQIATIGYDPVLGARPLRRAIQQKIEDTLSEKILFGEILAGETANVDFVDGEFVFSAASEPVKTKKPAAKAKKIVKKDV
jgi:ATP-dependent Clp protease ATP-binding subunit ClpC